MKRLSENTKAYLDGICFASNFVWTEGGMGYDYSSIVPEGFDWSAVESEKILAEHDDNFFTARHDQLLKLTRFLNAALGHNSDLESRYLPISTVADRFLSRINADVNAVSFSAELESDSFGMDIQIVFADESNQVVSILKMSWRID